MTSLRSHSAAMLGAFLFCSFLALVAVPPHVTSAADDAITVDKLDKLDKNDFGGDDWEKLQSQKKRIEDSQARLDKVENKSGEVAGILKGRIEDSKKSIGDILEKNNVTLDGKKPGGGGNNVVAAPPSNTTSLPLLVNLQGFADAGALTDVKKRVTMNVEDANKVLADNAKKQGKTTGLSLGPIKFKHNPKAATELKQGTDEFTQARRDGVKEVDKAFGKDKGTKIFVVPVLRQANGAVPSGLGTTPGRTAFFPDGDFDSEKDDESTQTFSVLRRRGGGDEFIDTASNGHFLLHELIHNSGLGSKNHQDGTIFAEQLDFGEPGKRKGHRTITKDQWDKLETFFQKYGEPPKKEKESSEQSSLLSEPGDSLYAAAPGGRDPSDTLAYAWGGTALDVDADGLYQSGDGSYLPDGSLVLAPEAGSAFTNTPMPASDPLISLGSDVLNTTPAFSASRAPGIQLMIIIVLRFRVPGNPVVRGEASGSSQVRGVLASMFGLLSSHPGHPEMLRTSYGIEATPSGLARSQGVAPAGGAPLQATIRALGVSTGEAFTVDILNEAAYPIDMSAAGVVVEPLNTPGGEAVQTGFKAEASGKTTHTEPANGYCLEFLQQPPPPGTTFRVAGPELQKEFQPMRSVLRAAQDLLDLGDLSPDSDPTQYFHSIVQWSLWSKEKGFDMKSFGEAFLDRTKKNFAAANQPWTTQAADAVRGLVPNRWNDIERVLQEAAFLDTSFEP